MLDASLAAAEVTRPTPSTSRTERTGYEPVPVEAVELALVPVLGPVEELADELPEPVCVDEAEIVPDDV